MFGDFFRECRCRKTDSSACGNAGRDAPMENHCEKMNDELADGDTCMQLNRIFIFKNRHDESLIAI